MSKEEEKIINTQLHDFKLPVIKTYFFRSTIPEKLDKEVKDMRDDFSQATKDLLANRVGWKCSNPQCRRPTRAAGSKMETVINIGIESLRHILPQRLKVVLVMIKICLLHKESLLKMEYGYVKHVLK